MSTQTIYMFENWFNPAQEISKGYHSYESLLEEALGKDSLLLFIEEEDYQGDWFALVTDGEQIGLVNGSFGSCSGCDMLEGVTSSQELKDLASEYLQSVRTFTSWGEVKDYIGGLTKHDWSFRFGRDEILEFASVEMPLKARDIFGCLRRDNIKISAVEAARSAKALH